MKKEPTISIIMASYNHAAFISEAIESVIQQDYNSWELLIADDCSTDNTLEVLNSYKDDSRIKVFSFKINRQYHMRNFAAKHANGEYIALLNSDDIFLPGKLRKQVEYLEKNPQTAAVFTHVKGIDEKSERISNSNLENVFAVNNLTRHEWLRHFFLFGNCLCISSVLIRSKCFNEIRAFNPLLVQIGDMDLWIKICLKWDIHVIDEKLTAMRILNDSKNLSAPSPVSNSRLLLEYQQVLEHYFSDSGFEQVLDIFPELKMSLPEDIPQWRYYLLCRSLAFVPFKSMRIFAFKKLHELLANEESKNILMQKNPRLMRTFFLSEGNADLWHDNPGVIWKINLPDQNGSYSNEKTYTYWTNVANSGVACFSFPNPGTNCFIGLSIEADPMPIECRQFRLYDQETGDIIFDSGKLTGNDEDIQKSEYVKVTPLANRRGDCPDYCFPEIDFAALLSKNIDIEIEYTPARFYNLYSYVKNKLGTKYSRLLSRLLPRF